MRLRTMNGSREKSREKRMDSSSWTGGSSEGRHGHQREGFRSGDLACQSPAVSTSTTSAPRSNSRSSGRVLPPSSPNQRIVPGPPSSSSSTTSLGRQSPAVSTSMTSVPTSNSSSSGRVLPPSSPNQRIVPGPPRSSSSTTSSARKRRCPPPPIISKEGERLARLNVHQESSSQNQSRRWSRSRSPQKIVTRRSPRHLGQRRQPQSEIEVITIISPSSSPSLSPVRATTPLRRTPEPVVITLSSPPPPTLSDSVDIDDDDEVMLLSPAPTPTPPLPLPDVPRLTSEKQNPKPPQEKNKNLAPTPPLPAASHLTLKNPKPAQEKKTKSRLPLEPAASSPLKASSSGTISPAPAPQHNRTTIGLPSPSLSPTPQQSPLIQKIINQGHRRFPNSILMPSAVPSLTSRTYLTKEVQTDPVRIINTLLSTDAATQTDPGLGDNQTMNQAISPSKKDASTFIHPGEFTSNEIDLKYEEYEDMEGDDVEEVRTYASVCAPLPAVPAEVETVSSPGPVEEASLALDYENEFPDLITGDDIDMEDVAAFSTSVAVEGNMSETTEDRNWMNSTMSFEERFDFMRKSPQYQKYMDVKFIVGQEGREKNVMGHELFLMTKYEYFREMFSGEKDNVKVIEGKGSHWRLKEVYLTEFDPNGFQLLIDYMYTGKIETSDLPVILKAADCAQKIGHSELIGELGNYLKKNFTKDNAVQIYCMAVAKNDLHLARESMAFISSNISDVVYSDGFLNLSEEDLCRFLESDDWTLGDELKVFELVERWATHKVDRVDPSRIQSEELRAVHRIRFTQFSAKDIPRLFSSKVQLFSADEVVGLTKYVLQRENMKLMEDQRAPLPPKFVARSRGGLGSTSILEKMIHAPPENSTLEAESESGAESGQGSEEREISRYQDVEVDMNLDMDVYNVILEKSYDENMEFQFEPVETDRGKQEERHRKEDDIVEAEMGDLEIQCSAVSAGCSGAIFGDSDSDNSSKPSLSSLSSTIEVLRQAPEMENLDREVINQTLLLTKISSTRVHLPNLKKFEVRLVSEKIMDSGVELKKYIKRTFSKLSDILFFDVNVGHDRRQDEILENLLGTKVNILVTFAQSTILFIDHGQGKVIMNMLKGSQTDEILKGCRKCDFRLKILGISDCDLSSLNCIQKEALEVLQIRAVKGLKGFGNFLQQCPNLKSVCWNHLNDETIEVEKQLSSKMSNLEHLALAKCSLVDFGDGWKPFGNLKSLYLNQCNWDRNFVQRIPQMFPSLKKVLIYGKTGDSHFLYWILKKIPSIECVFMWKMNYVYVYLPSSNQEEVESATPSDVGRINHARIISGLSGVVKVFMSEVFDINFAKKDFVTFILKKQNRLDEIEPVEEQEEGASDDNANDDNDEGTEVLQGRKLMLSSKGWVGHILMEPERSRVAKEGNFLVNRNDEFFKDFGVFALMNTGTTGKTKSNKTELQKSVANLLCSPYYGKINNEKP